MLNESLGFGPFEANLTSGELRRDGVPVPVQDLPFRLLAALLERQGEVVTRAELSSRLWGADTFVDSTAGLNTAIAKLREALGDDAEHPVYIETVPKRGYRFIGRIEPLPGGAWAATRPRTGTTWPAAAWITAACAMLAIVALAAYQLRADRPKTRVAVILFDDETGRKEFSRLAQGLTDATVFELTAQPTLAVIGNAAVLRTTRPFRDLAAVRDALHADFIVIGQVQTVDDGILVRAHLIRAKDESHVWVDVVKMTSAGEAALQSAVAGRIALAVSTHARSAH